MPKSMPLPSSSVCALLLAVPLALGLSACSDSHADHGTTVTPVANDTPSTEKPVVTAADRETLQTRASALWAAREAEDWAAVFEFLDPSRTAEVTVEQYVAWATDSEPFKVHAYDIAGVQIDGIYGWVQIDATMSMRKFDVAPAQRSERWEKWWNLDGTWYPTPRQAQEAVPEAPSLRNPQAEAALAERFEASCRLRAAADWAALYAMSDPGDRNQVPFEDFERSFDRTIYVKHDFVWAQVIGNSGRVRVVFEFKLNDPSLTKMAPQRQPITEDWILVDGVWYLDLVTTE